MDVEEIIGKMNVKFEDIERLANMGAIIVKDSDDQKFKFLKEIEEKINSIDWGFYAKIFHFMTKWKDVNVGISEDLKEATIQSYQQLKALIERNPPPHFYTREDKIKEIELPLKLYETSYPILQVLLKRETRREFDLNIPLDFDKFNIINFKIITNVNYCSIFC